ncbi:MAG: FAD-dependent oxidoreductase [Verrucomicrobiota bacterium]
MNNGRSTAVTFSTNHSAWEAEDATDLFQRPLFTKPLRLTLRAQSRSVVTLTLFLCLVFQAAILAEEKGQLGAKGETVIEPRREIPITHRADVVVIGAAEGGLGGCTAAVAAARRGASVLLIEEQGYVGLHVPIALGVVVGIPKWRPTMQEGLFRDFVGYVARTGQYASEPLTPEEITRRGEIIIRYHDVASTAMLAMMRDAGVQTLFHAKFVETVVEKNAIKAIIVETPQGRIAIAGKVFVDSTALAEVAFKAGAPTIREEPYMSLQAFLGKVDEPKYLKWLAENKEPLDDSFKKWMEQQVGPFEKLKHPWNQWWPEFLGDRFPPAVVRKVRDAQSKGELKLFHRRGAEGTLAIVEGIKSRTDIAMPRTYITGLDPLNADDVNWAEMTSRLALVEFQRFLQKHIPGFENCVLERVADTISLRGGRYIQVDPPITPEQVSGGGTNADCIFVFSRNDGHVFEVPYRAFVAKDVENLFVVGKASGGGRVMGQAHCILFQGQAAGTAAAMCVKENLTPRKIDIAKLQAALKADGVEIPYPIAPPKAPSEKTK